MREYYFDSGSGIQYRLIDNPCWWPENPSGNYQPRWFHHPIGRWKVLTYKEI
jgi:hypothetical protein